MNRRLKNLILFGIFIIILFISTLAKQFSTEILWKQDSDTAKEFQGLLFQNPTEISNLKVSRTPVEGANGNLVRYDVDFTYSGEGSSFRILGTPVRQIFFESPILAEHSVVSLKGDYDKVSQVLMNDKLALNLPLNNEDLKLSSKSEIKVTLDPEVENYTFSMYYNPMNIKYMQENVISQISVFLTNAKIDKFTNSQNITDVQNTNFTESGYNVNVQEYKNNSKLTEISLINNLSKIIFVVSTVLSVALIWIDKKSLSTLFIPIFMLMVLSFYRFLDMGISTFGALCIMPIIAYISACISKLMGRDTLKLTKKDYKQNLAFTIVFFIIVLVVIIIPRAI